MTGLCSVPLWIRNNNDEYLNKNESITKTVSVSSSEEGTEAWLKQSEKRFSKLHPYSSSCVKLGSPQHGYLGSKPDLIYLF